jgi:hypothetical protein
MSLRGIRQARQCVREVFAIHACALRIIGIGASLGCDF